MEIKIKKSILIYDNDGLNDFIKHKIFEGDKVSFQIKNNNNVIENVIVENISIEKNEVTFRNEDYFRRTLMISEISKIILK